MNTWIVGAVRLYLRTLALVAPKVAGRQAYRLFSTPRRRASIPSKAEAEMARAERFDVMAGDLRIAGYRWQQEGVDSPPRVMLVHGWESRAARLALWVAPLREAGFEVVAFDAPAHGESEGKTSNPLGFVEAMLAVVEHVGPISACVGHSLGGYSSMLAVSGGPLLGREALEVERLLIIAGADSGVDAMSMFCDVLGLGQGFLPLVLAAAAEEADQSISDFDAHRLFPDYPIPTLWMHASEDQEVPIEAAERVARACSHVMLELRDGLGHHRIARAPKVLRRGLDFLSEITGGSVAA